MTVLLVLGTFLVFIVLDYVMNSRKAIATVPLQAQAAAQAGALMGPGADYVNGFHIPENLSYHSGHGWLVRERKNVVRVGADEFAAALAGNVEKVELPKPGQWIRQGQKVLSFYRNGEKTEMVSPTEGEVLEVNAEVLGNPAKLRQDPYGKGWLLAVHVPDEENTTRNLIPKGLVREWMRESVERLYAMQPSLAGAVAADGGRPADDLLAAFPQTNWKAVTGEFFLTA
ncbi:Glycine cleavage H-protein [Candidatus Sulfopaludibacter sp. SbA3]|nr:Glycine cleavage H-protein [Candidatus Sulfopaludibacter sp. SbA3]